MSSTYFDNQRIFWIVEKIGWVEVQEIGFVDNFGIINLKLFTKFKLWKRQKCTGELHKWKNTRQESRGVLGLATDSDVDSFQIVFCLK